MVDLSAATNVPEQERLRAELVPRPWVMARLETWLGDDDSRIFLVTGPPGTGKTSLAAQFVLAGQGLVGGEHERLRAAEVAYAHFCDSSNERTLDPLDFVNALSHSLAERIPGFVEALVDSASGASAAVTINSTQTVEVAHAGASVTNVRISLPRDVPTRQAFAHLVRRPLEAVVEGGWTRQVLVVVDDLSGGYRYDSEDNIARLIGVVADNPAELPKFLRFVVTSRPDPWVLRDLPPRALDLHDDQPEDQDDIRRYVDRRLGTLPEPGRGAWVDHVTWAADGNFLYARHALDHLLADPEALAGGPAGYELPAGLTELYRRWFTGGVARNRDLWWDCHQPVLTALTVARGAGLTRDQLAGITGLPTMKVRRALDECTQFLLGPPAGPVRLYHDSFRDFLAGEEVSVADGHRMVAEFFLRRHADDWLSADTYAADHLITHAAATGAVPELLDRPDYLVVAEPTAVLHELSRTDAGGTRNAEVYARASWLLADRERGERASYLGLAAQELGETELAAALAGLPLSRGWRPCWTVQLRHRPSQVVGAHPGGVAAMLAVDHEHGTGVATVGFDGRLRLWDLRTHTLVSTMDAAGHYSAAALVALEDAGAGWLAVADARAVSLVHRGRGDVVRQLPVRADSFVTAAAAIRVLGREALVLGYADGAIEVVGTADGQLIAGPVQAHRGPVLSITSAFANAVVSSGADGAVIGWSFDEGVGNEVLISSADQAWWTAANVAWPEENGDMVLCAGFSDGMTYVVTYRGDETEKFAVTAHLPAAWCGRHHALDPSGGSSQTVTTNSKENSFDAVHRTHLDVERRRREEWETQRDMGHETESTAPPEPKEIIRVGGGVNSLAMARVDARQYLASGGEDGRVAIFDVRHGAESLDYLSPEGDPVSVVRFAESDGRLVLLAAEAGQAGTIREWRIEHGESPLPPLIGDLETPVLHFDVTEDVTGRPLVALAFVDDSVVLRHVDGDAVLAGPLPGELVLTGVHVCQHRDRTLLIAYGRAADTKEGAARLWELRSPADLTVHDIRFPELTDLRGVTGLDDHACLLAAGLPRGEETAAIWRLDETDTGWTPSPVPLTVAPNSRWDEIPTEPDWIRSLPGQDRRLVAIGESPDIHIVCLDDLTVDNLFQWSEEPAAPILYEGEPALLVASHTVDIVLVDQNAAAPGTLFETTSTSDVQVVAATTNGDLVVGGTEDGQLLVWRAPGPPAQVIQLNSTVRQLAISGDDTILVRTTLGVHTFRLE